MHLYPPKDYLQCHMYIYLIFASVKDVILKTKSITTQQIKSPDNVSIISLQEILGTLSKLLPVQNFYGAISDIIGQIR